MGMELNVTKCRRSATAHHTIVWLRLRPDLSHPLVSFCAASSVPYLGVSLLPSGDAVLLDKHLRRILGVVSLCSSSMAPEALTQEVPSSVVGGVVQYASLYLSDDDAPVKAPHKAIKAASFRSERLTFDLSKVALYSKDGMHADGVTTLVEDWSISTLAVLAQHTSHRVRDAVEGMLDKIHGKYGICGPYLIPHARFSKLTRPD